MLRTALFVALLGAALAQDTVTIKLPFGDVIGSASASGNAFYAIPYAVPPLQSLRWTPTQPWGDAFEGGSLDASANKGVKCYQHALQRGTEDCLVLTVYTPAGLPSGRPVLFWVHGGSYNSGAGTDAAFDGHKLSSATGSVVVMPNYRLGPMGYMALDELLAESGTTGNYGLLDQLEALRWVQRNIAAFGGDASNVLLFGEGSGAESVLAIYANQQTRGLYRAVAAQSAPYWPHTLAESIANTRILTDKAGCTGTGDQLLSCLRNLETTLIFAGDSIIVRNNWGVTVDGKALAATPLDLISKGSFSGVPLMLGTNENELNALVWQFSPGAPKDQYEATIALLLPCVAGNKTLLAQVVAMYPPIDGDNRGLIGDIITDRNYTCPTRRIARAASKLVETYAYRFTSQPNCTVVPGSLQGDEIEYIFQNTDKCPLSPSDTELGAKMQLYWNSMAISGNPNSGKHVESPAWKMFAASNYLSLNPTNLQMFSGLREKYCDFWDKMSS